MSALTHWCCNQTHSPAASESSWRGSIYELPTRTVAQASAWPTAVVTLSGRRSFGGGPLCLPSLLRTSSAMPRDLHYKCPFLPEQVGEPMGHCCSFCPWVPWPVLPVDGIWKLGPGPQGERSHSKDPWLSPECQSAGGVVPS